MKKIFFYSKWFLIVGIFVGIFLLFRTDAGYIVVDVSGFHYESSLFLVVAVVAGLCLVWYLLKLIMRGINFTFNLLNPWNKAKQKTKNLVNLHKGTIALCEDDLVSAKKYLAKSKDLISQLLLLKTISYTEDVQESTNIAQKLVKEFPQTKLVSAILHNQTLLNAGKYEQAEPAIKLLFEQNKNNKKVADLIKQLLIKTNKLPE